MDESLAHPRAPDMIARAHQLIGTPFITQGRLAHVGLDCIGVIWDIAEHIGCPLRVPADYSLASPRGRDLEQALRSYGFMQRAGSALPADVVVMQGPAQRQHLGLWTGDYIIHAHIGLRRVVCAPEHPDWPIRSAWRMPQGR